MSGVRNLCYELWCRFFNVLVVSDDEATIFVILDRSVGLPSVQEGGNGRSRGLCRCTSLLERGSKSTPLRSPRGGKTAMRVTAEGRVDSALRDLAMRSAPELLFPVLLKINVFHENGINIHQFRGCLSIWVKRTFNSYYIMYERIHCGTSHEKGSAGVPGA